MLVSIKHYRNYLTSCILLSFHAATAERQVILDEIAEINRHTNTLYVHARTSEANYVSISHEAPGTG